MYPISLLEEFRNHFYATWIPTRMNGYFSERDPNALPFVDRVLLEYQEQLKIQNSN